MCVSEANWREPVYSAQHMHPEDQTQAIRSGHNSVSIIAAPHSLIFCNLHSQNSSFLVSLAVWLLLSLVSSPTTFEVFIIWSAVLRQVPFELMIIPVWDGLLPFQVCVPLALDSLQLQEKQAHSPENSPTSPVYWPQSELHLPHVFSSICVSFCFPVLVVGILF